MGRPRKHPEAGVNVKELEKIRAKKNRDVFRALILDLNQCLSREKLSTNRCLSTAISVMNLDQYQRPPRDEKHKPSSGRVVSQILRARDCIGLGFDEKGMVIYTSENLQRELGIKDSILGESLGRDTSLYMVTGKVLTCDSGKRMFLGYAERRDNIISNPLQMFGMNEVQIAADLSFIGPRHTYIDNLLGYEIYADCTTEHVLTEDLVESAARAQSFQREGFAQHVCRLKCVDNSVLYVLCKVFLTFNDAGEVVMVSYSLPFAFNTHGSQFIDESLRFITSDEAWLALVPSFYKGQEKLPTSPTSPLETLSGADKSDINHPTCSSSNSLITKTEALTPPLSLEDAPVYGDGFSKSVYAFEFLPEDCELNPCGLNPKFHKSGEQ